MDFRGIKLDYMSLAPMVTVKPQEIMHVFLWGFSLSFTSLASTLSHPMYVSASMEKVAAHLQAAVAPLSWIPAYPEIKI